MNPNWLLFHRERDRETERERERERERWCFENIQSRSVLRIIVGQGSIALAVGAGGGSLDFFSLVTARYRLKYCLKGPLNPKQLTNQIQS